MAYWTAEVDGLEVREQEWSEMNKIIASKIYNNLFHRSFITMSAPRVELPDVERLSPSVIRILGGNPGKVCLSDSRIS